MYPLCWPYISLSLSIYIYIYIYIYYYTFIHKYIVTPFVPFYARAWFACQGKPSTRDDTAAGYGGIWGGYGGTCIQGDINK